MWEVGGRSEAQINKRLAEDQEVPSQELPLHNTNHFDQTKSIRVLLEPDYSIILFVNVLIRPQPGFAPAVNRLRVKGDVVRELEGNEQQSVYRHIASSQEVPISGEVEIPYVPELPWKQGTAACQVPFSVVYNSVPIVPDRTQIPSIVVTNEPSDMFQYITLKNEIYDTLTLMVNWVNLYNIGPEIGEVRFFVQDSGIPEKESFFSSIDNHLRQSKSMTKIDSIVLTAKASVTLVVFWKAGMRFKQCCNQAVVTSLGMMAVVPKRSNSMLLHVPILLKPVVSHLIVSPTEVKLPDFNFGRVFTLKLTLCNTSDEPMTVVSRPSLLYTSPIQETLRPREKKVVSVPVQCSAKALQNNNLVQESIGFVCPDSIVNQASCLFTAVISNPLFLTLPELDPNNTGRPGVFQIAPIFFSSPTQESAFSITSLRIRNLRDIDVFVQVSEEGKNHFTLLDYSLQPTEYAKIPQESEATVQLKFTTSNRYFQSADGTCTSPFRLFKGKARITGFSVLTKTETLSLRESDSSFQDAEYMSLTQLTSSLPDLPAETPETENDLTSLFSFLVDYSGVAGTVQFSLSETQFLLIPKDSQTRSISREVKITNLNPGMKLPFCIKVIECSNPSLRIKLSKSGGILEEGKYTYFVFTASFSCVGYNYFILRVSDEEETVYQDIRAHVFVTSESLSITEKDAVPRGLSAFPAVSIGNVAVCRDASGHIAMNPHGASSVVLTITNTSGITTTITPFSTLPLRIAEPAMPPDFFSSLDFPDTSFSLQDTIPSFFDYLNARPCCSGFELLSDQTVEVALSVVPREPVLACSKEQAEEIESRGEAAFSGEIFFFNSRRENCIQQILTVSGVYYIEHISVSCKTTDFGYIFVNSSRPRRLDIRITNLSRNKVDIDLSKLPVGFVPAVFYIFSQKHANQNMKRNTIDRTKSPSFPIDEGCYAILTVELDMKKVNYQNGKNFWQLVFSTKCNPTEECVVDLQATVFTDAICCRVKDAVVEESLLWQGIPFPSLQDSVLEMEVCNQCPLSVRIQPIFCQEWLQQALSVSVTPTLFSLQQGKKMTLRLSLHVITMSNLDQKQYCQMNSSSQLGTLQLFVDINTKQENGKTRTITEIPCLADFSLLGLIEVVPPVLNIIATVEHYSKLDELFVPHFNLPPGSSQLSKPPSSTELSLMDTTAEPDSSLSTPRDVDETAIEDVVVTPRLSQKQALSDHLKESALHSVICSVSKDAFEFEIRNRWRERLTVTLHRTQLKHAKHGILFPGESEPVYSSFIEVPERIVIEPEGTVTVTARIIPDTIDGKEKVSVMCGIDRSPKMTRRCPHRWFFKPPSVPSCPSIFPS